MNSVRRATLGATLLVTTALGLTGCVRLDSDLTLNADDTFTGEAVVAFSDAVLEQTGMSAEEMLESFTDGAATSSDYVTEPYAQDGYTGFTMLFEDASFDELDDSLGIEVDRVGDDFVVGGSYGGDEDSAASEPLDPQTVEVLGEFYTGLSITFPGPVAQHNGTLEGTTVFWESTTGDPLAVEATGSALTQAELDAIARAEAEAKAAADRAALLRKIAAGAGIALGVAVLLVAGIVIGKRATRSQAAQSAPDGEPGDPAESADTEPKADAPVAG